MTRAAQATRPGERPAQARVVGQRIEVQPRGGVEREAVEVALAEADIPGDHAGRVRPGKGDGARVAAAGGVGSEVERALQSLNLPRRSLRIGLPDQFIEHGDMVNLYKSAGLDKDSLRSRIQQFLSY